MLTLLAHIKDSTERVDKCHLFLKVNTTLQYGRVVIFNMRFLAKDVFVDNLFMQKIQKHKNIP